MEEKDISIMSAEELERYETELNERLEDAKMRKEEYSDGRHPTSHYLAACDILEIESELRDVAEEREKR